MDDDLSDSDDFLDDQEEDHPDAWAEDIEEPVIDIHRSVNEKFLEVLRSSEPAQEKGSKLADIIVDAYLTKHARGILNPPHWVACITLHEIAELVPRHHPWQDSLLECVTQLMHRADYRWKKHTTFWDAMEEFERHRLNKFDRGRNYNKFLVGFTRAHYELLVEHDIGSAGDRLMYMVLGQTILGLETPRNEEEPLWHWKRDVLNAADWFIDDAYRVLKFMLINFHPFLDRRKRGNTWASLGSLARGELSTEDPFCCVKRWKFWKRRFAAILDEGLMDGDDDHARHILGALRAMRRAEMAMKQAYESDDESDDGNSPFPAVEHDEVLDMIKAILQSPESPHAKGEKLANTILDLHAASNEHEYGGPGEPWTVWGVFWYLVLQERRERRYQGWQDALVECVAEVKRRRYDAWEAICAFESSVSNQMFNDYVDVEFYHQEADDTFEVHRILNRLKVRFALADYKLGLGINTEILSEIGDCAVWMIAASLESPQPSIDDGWLRRRWELMVLKAVDWLVEWAEGVYFMTGPSKSTKILMTWKMERRWVAPRLCGEDQLDPDTPAFRLHRWESWKSRLTTILDRQLLSDNPHHVKRIRLAIRRMNRAEETGKAARENRLAAEALPGNPYEEDDLPGADERHEQYVKEDKYLQWFEDNALRRAGYYPLDTELAPVVKKMRSILETPRATEARGEMLADYIIAQSSLPGFQISVRNIWGCFLLIASEAPKNDPYQNGLLECLESLRHREGCTWWIDSFADELWAQCEGTDRYASRSNQEMTNLNSFVARFKRGEYKQGLSISPDEARENLAPFVLANLMQGVEWNIDKLQRDHEAHGFREHHDIESEWDSLESFGGVHRFWEGAVWRAADWLIECADEIYNLMTSGYEVIQIMNKNKEMPPLLDGWFSDWLGADELNQELGNCTVKRWALWKRQFAAILESNLIISPRRVGYVRLAIERMNAAEQCAGGNAEEMGQEQEQEQGSSP